MEVDRTPIKNVRNKVVSIHIILPSMGKDILRLKPLPEAVLNGPFFIHKIRLMNTPPIFWKCSET
jgi:hypothetical protein